MDETTKIYLVIFVEGQTDKEFYKKMVEYLRNNNPEKKSIPVIYKNLRSVTNYNRASSVFQNEILKKSENPKIDKFLVICSYDNDVFNNVYQQKPPVDWKKVRKELKRHNSVKGVFEIKAIDSIEDWFLKDMEGLCSYLKSTKLPKLKELPGNTGEEKIKSLFLKNQKVYQKGHNVQKFVDFLNFEQLYGSLKEELKILESCLFNEN